MTNFTDSDFEKAKQMAEPTSLAALMKSNARMKKHAAVAAKAVPKQDYAGPEGEVVVLFSKKVIVTKDGANYVIFDFNVDGTVEGQEKYASHRIGILFGLADSEYATLEQRLEELYCLIQIMGVKTVDAAGKPRSIEDIDKDIDALKQKQFKVRCTKSKKNGKMYFDVIGRADEDDADYSGDTVVDDDDSVEYTDEDTVLSETDDENEWAEEEAEAEAEEAEADASEYNPSDWISFEVEYKPAKAPRPLVFTVVDADDDAGTVVLDREGKKIKNVPFADLILP